LLIPGDVLVTVDDTVLLRVLDSDASADADQPGATP